MARENLPIPGLLCFLFSPGEASHQALSSRVPAVELVCTREVTAVRDKLP